jgi:hypothetical protein
MFLNHNRKPVEDCAGDEDSRCPDCDAKLIAKRGEIKVWHWAHKANVAGCEHYESEWHLRWKAVYAGFSGWEVEFPIDIESNKYRLDAFSLNTGAIREFVHTLSRTYVDKHSNLRKSGRPDILWIWDGLTFMSAWARKYRWDNPAQRSIRDFLKPGALNTFNQIGGIVHYDGTLWKQWKENIWFPILSKRCSRLCEMFAMQGSKIIKRNDGDDDEAQGVLREATGSIPEITRLDGDQGIRIETEQVESAGGETGRPLRADNGNAGILPDDSGVHGGRDRGGDEDETPTPGDDVEIIHRQRAALCNEDF